MQIVILGYIVRGPLGGLAWHHLQYVLGLKALGHEVLFLEDSDDFPGCYNPDTFEVSKHPEYGLKFIQDLFHSFDLDEQWAYYDAHTNIWYGQSQQKVLGFCTRADMVLNLSGVNPLRHWCASIPIRVYVDTDPGFTQIRHLTDLSAKALAIEHTNYFSFAENIGKKDCFIPEDGFQWKITRQPVFLDAWKMSPGTPSSKWTTVMQWDSYKAREMNGQLFGMKSLSFKEYDLLPQKVPDETFELALGSATAPTEELKNKGWNIISSLVPTKTPWSFQNYIANSKGEWSVAKHGYVVSNSGWFSERTLNYMASGKPVVVHNTGFTDFLPTGKGLFAFSSLEEAVESLKEVNKSYSFHCISASKLVVEYFDSAKVLTSLLNTL